MKAVIDVYRIPEDWHPYPWRFAVTFNGQRHTFAGLANQCERRGQAMARAVWRARWLEQGTYDLRYGGAF
jgi:hypothetical protein